AEICDGRDNNCDGVLDFADTDGDGFYSVCPTDCDDTDQSVNPAADEVCGDGIDNDCDGTDQACPGGEIDDDHDGFCEDENGDGFCDDGSIGDPRDCDDTNRAVNPDAEEICGNGIDDNCNGDPDYGDPACDEAPPPPPPPVDCDDRLNALNPACQETVVPTGGFAGTLRGGSAVGGCSLRR
ncbi:MAG: MopE-related protein, partial [Deltaproteobacteria bacterium]|nr:MopE-related protein [Deltaproteobacteria bacterium]